MMLNVVEIETWYGAIQALKGISLDVNQGEVVALLGANGAGKSTTIKTITGLLKPAKGRIEFMGQVITGKEPEDIAEIGIACVPEGRHIFPGLTVLDNLMLGTTPRKQASQNDIERDLDRVYGIFPQLKESRKRLGWTLSGGQQQMLSIARALLNPNRLLLIDEPTKGLAPALVADVAHVLERVAETETALLVEQNLGVVRRLAGSIVVLDQGRVVHVGHASDLDDRALVHRLLGVGAA